MSAASTSTTTPPNNNNNNIISVEYVENELSESDLVNTKLTTTTHYMSGQIESIVQAVDEIDEIPCKKSRVDMDHQQQQDHGVILTDDNHHAVNNVHGEETIDNSSPPVSEEQDPMKDQKLPSQVNIIRVRDKPKNNNTYNNKYASIAIKQENYVRPVQGTAGAFRRRRGGRINAAEVIRAVELDEFTGYELLQILKTIAPKL